MARLPSGVMAGSASRSSAHMRSAVKGSRFASWSPADRTVEKHSAPSASQGRVMNSPLQNELEGERWPAILPTHDLPTQAVPDRFDPVALRPGVQPGQNPPHERSVET